MVTVAVIVFGFGLAGFWPVMIAHGMATFPDESRAGDWGAVTAVFLLTESLGSTYVGVVIETLGYTAAYGSLLVAYAVTVAITAWLSRGE